MAKRLYLTAIENIALSLVFLVMNERRFNRSLAEYLSIAAKLPPLKALLQKVNELLKEMHQKSNDAGVPLPLICRFQAATSDMNLKTILAKFPVKLFGWHWRLAACARHVEELSPSNYYLAIRNKTF